MMFKNIKDEFIKNRNHQSVFVMQESVLNNPNEDHINEEKLIMDLIQKKKRELNQRKTTTKDDQSELNSMLSS